MKAKDKERRIVSDEDDEIMVLVQSVYFHLRSSVSRVIERLTRYILMEDLVKYPCMKLTSRKKGWLEDFNLAANY